MAVTVLNLADAIEESGAYEGDRSVLLGNGFSIAWHYETFHYQSLFDEAKFNGLSVDKGRLFSKLDTHDFEVVVDYLKSAAGLATLYGTTDKAIARRLRRDARIVRLGLAQVLSARHPSSAKDVTPAEYECARRFLVNFSRIYSTNYDLLMYWAVNADHGSNYKVVSGDGFQWPTYNGPRSRLIWKNAVADQSQSLFHLHGALHLFVDADRRLRKLSYQRAVPLVEQIRERLEKDQYPLVVTEGRSTEKMARIERSPYLRYCRARFAQQDGTLFIYGSSLSDNDSHILSLLESRDSQIHSAYISVYGPAGDPDRRRVIERARDIRDKRRRAGNPLRLRFFAAESAAVWRDR